MSVGEAKSGFEPIELDSIEASIPSMFDVQVERQPDHTAIWTPTRQLSYAELTQVAASLAAAILAERVSASKPVAILFSQGAPLIATVLGVLKAGHFYLPLNADYPSAWIRGILEHSGAELIVCDGANRALAATHSPGRRVLCWDDLDFASTGPSALPGVAPDAYAYVYYTSGSTGAPKGVLDGHRNVLHNIRRYVNGLEIVPGDRLALVQQPGFSGAVSSMFCALLTGATLYPIDPRTLAPQQLGRWVNQNRLTMWHSTPSLFRQLASSGLTFPSVRVVRLEGDQASPSDVGVFKRCFSREAVMVNGLGATETGIVRRFFVRPEEQVDGAILPVGYPVEDMEVEVVDDDGRSVVGKVGEVIVRSRYLALGYWGEAELTAQRFRAVPGDRGVRSYRTGDLGLMHEDGCLELHGRSDDRFKISGQWVSLVEVESALARAPGVAECAASSFQDRHGDTRLIAYFTSAQTPAPNSGALREWLDDQVPAYFVPSVFVEVERLPLTSYGKLDRRGLAQHERARPSLKTTYRAPETGLEQELTEVWHAALELDAVGIDDDIFDLGGDSLAVMRILSQISDNWGVLISPEALLEAGTVAATARLIIVKAAAGVEREMLGEILEEIESAPEPYR